ncbi:MAG TPA: DUF4126 domain-containing protein [Chitinophagaceae bacterium]
MMDIDYHTISAVALGIALSACCGFRVFIPLLVASIAVYNHWFVLPGDMHWMGSGFSVTCFAAASVIEVGAYYFPFLDNILDTVAAPLAVAAGTLLAYAVIPFPEGEPFLHWVMAFVAGGATAGTIHIGTGIWRLFSTKATLGTGNPVLATGENAAAIAGAIASFFIPLIMSIVMLLIVGWFAYQEIIRATTPGKSNLP